MKALEVNCITLSGHLPHHALITHIGHSQRKWRIAIAPAIRCMDLDLERYYVVDTQLRQWVYLDVVREPGQPPHVRARTERGELADHLLALPHCGPDCGTPAATPCRARARIASACGCCPGCRCRSRYL
jgi:hypothetical protein